MNMCKFAYENIMYTTQVPGFAGVALPDGVPTEEEYVKAYLRRTVCACVRICTTTCIQIYIYVYIPQRRSMCV